MKKDYAWAVNLAGWLALGFGLLGWIIFHIGLWNGHPFNPVVALEICLMIILGVVTSVIARAFKRIEARVTKIERRLSE